MKTIAKKVMVVGAVVVGITIGAGGMEVSAGPQQTNRLLRGDSGGSATVTVRHAPASETVHQGRYRIGFLP